MKRGQAFPGTYINQDAVTANGGTIRGKIMVVKPESVKAPDGTTSEEAVMYLDSDERGLILNRTNWALLEEMTGKDDSDDWNGTSVELYIDPNVSFGGKRVGGVRVRPVEGGDEEPPF